VTDVPALVAAFAEGIGRFVQFAAEHPGLNQITVHDGAAATDRLAWVTETHVKPLFEACSRGGRCFVTPHTGAAFLPGG
jgi:hypothetical protein